MRAVETGSSVGSSYVDALAYAVSSCVTEPSWRRGVMCRAASQRLAGSCQDASRCLRATQWPKCHGVSSYVDGGSTRVRRWVSPDVWTCRISIADLRSHPFDHTDLRPCRDDARQLEAGGFVERVELRFRALAPAGADEHVDIVGGGAAAGLRLVDARWVDTLDDQQAGRRPHRAAAALQDLCGVHVIPIVYDML